MSAPPAEAARAGRPSLVQRLVALAAGWSVVVLVLTGLALSAFFDHAAVTRLDHGLVQDADDLYSGSTVGDGGEVIAPALTDARALRPFTGHYWELGEARPDGRVHAFPETAAGGSPRSRSMWDGEDLPSPPGLPAKLARKPSGHAAYNGVWHGQSVRVVAIERRLPGRRAPIAFLVAEDRSAINRDVRGFALTTATTLLLLGAGLVAAVVLQVRVGLRPLFAMGRDVARVREGGAERLAAAAYPRELSPLAGELNALLDHNQEVVERQRTHVGNLAHALKTPLSVMLSEAERHPGALAAVVERQAQTMRAQVDHHLRRARAAAHAQGSGERTAVAAVLDELARTLDRIYGRRGVDIAWDAADDLHFLGERQDLLEMVGNLLENACKYSGGQVEAQAAAADGGLLLSVDDDGPGLPPERRAEALKRGLRLDETGVGSGLGLSIVDDLARAYGGSLALEASALGGLRAELRLPRAQAERG